MKLGSLFDGSGGFPLAGALCGIEPIWASEVEPYPIAVTKSRFPNMKHLGDISKINGAEIEPVDIITFGSPCQDLSVAGKRAGLKHENHGADETTRSGLFMEAVRIIKEMREKTNGKYPRFAVWENVPGAFSSNKGEDFKVVLEELIKVVETNAIMPKVPPFGWAYADSYCGDGWSLAYRVLDAQYWGVPQRRRRIYLVADFGGQCARKILFEREGLRRCFEEGGTSWKATPSSVKGSVGTNDCEGKIPYTLKIRCGCDGGGKGALIQKNQSATLACNNDQYLFQYIVEDVHKTVDKNILDDQGGSQISVRTDGKSPTLRAEMHGNIPSVMELAPATVYAVENHPHDSRVKIDESGKVQSLTGRMGTGGGNVPMVMEPFCKSHRAQTAEDATTRKHCKVANTLNTFDQGEARANELVVETVAIEGNGQRPSHQGDGYSVTDKSYTLNATEVHGVAYQEVIGALYAGDSKVGSQYVGQNKLIVEPYEVHNRYIVRRLMPVECARLQGFADHWGDIDAKIEFSNEEYAFWLEVRNTHATINGKKTKEYTKAQMLTWYNKLNTDGAEYKMWGNGIALPTALYVMQGIKEALNESY